MQQIVCRHCFLATTGYDNNKGQVLASVYYHYNLSCSPSQFTGINVQLIYDQISMVEWIDDYRLKVTLSINLMFVQR